MVFYHVHAINNWEFVMSDQLAKLVFSGLYRHMVACYSGVTGRTQQEVCGRGALTFTGLGSQAVSAGRHTSTVRSQAGCAAGARRLETGCYYDCPPLARCRHAQLTVMAVRLVGKAYLCQFIIANVSPLAMYEFDTTLIETIVMLLHHAGGCDFTRGQ